MRNTTSTAMWRDTVGRMEEPTPGRSYQRVWSWPVVCEAADDVKVPFTSVSFVWFDSFVMCVRAPPTADAPERNGGMYSEMETEWIAVE